MIKRRCDKCGEAYLLAKGVRAHVCRPSKLKPQSSPSEPVVAREVEVITTRDVGSLDELTSVITADDMLTKSPPPFVGGEGEFSGAGASGSYDSDSSSSDSSSSSSDASSGAGDSSGD